MVKHTTALRHILQQTLFQFVSFINKLFMPWRISGGWLKKYLISKNATPALLSPFWTEIWYLQLRIWREEGLKNRTSTKVPGIFFQFLIQQRSCCPGLGAEPETKQPEVSKLFPAPQDPGITHGPLGWRLSDTPVVMLFYVLDWSHLTSEHLL